MQYETSETDPVHKVWRRFFIVPEHDQVTRSSGHIDRMRIAASPDDCVAQGSCMNIKMFHFIREVLRTDLRGKETPTMQFSDDNASYLHPAFRWAPFADEAQMRALYVRLGGQRADGVEIGTTVIIPNRA